MPSLELPTQYNSQLNTTSYLNPVQTVAAMRARNAQQPTNMRRDRPPANEASRKADAECKANTGARRARTANGVKPKLRQHIYYKFKKDVVIYHFRASFVSVEQFRSLWNREQHGYVDSLLGNDLLGDKSDADGDETPEDCIEACYMLGVFQQGGSALGFRLGNGTVEWVCFDRDIMATIINKTPTDELLFDHVASVSKPAYINKSRKVPYTEHRDWFESLRSARKRPLSLALTWRNRGTELKGEYARRRKMSEVREGAREVLTGPENSEVSDAEKSSDDGWDEESNNFGSDEVQCQDEQLDKEQGQGIGGFESERGMHSSRRITDSPMTIGRRTPVVYRDPSPVHGFTPPPTVNRKHSRSSSSNSVLSNRSVNTLQVHYRPSANQKATDQHLMNGGYF